MHVKSNIAERVIETATGEHIELVIRDLIGAVRDVKYEAEEF